MSRREWPAMAHLMFIAEEERDVELLILLRSHFRVGVGHANVELGGALADLLALAHGDVVCDLYAVFAVVHEQDLELLQRKNGKRQ